MKLTVQENPSSPFRQPFLWTLVAASFFFGLFLFYGYKGESVTVEVEELNEAAMVANIGENLRAPMPERKKGGKRAPTEGLRIHNGRVGKHDTFYDILTAQGVPPLMVSRIVAAAKPVFDLGRIRAGNAYRLGFKGDGKLALLEYEIDGDRLVRVKRIEGRLEAELDAIDYEAREVAVSAAIDSSLYSAAVGIGEGPMLAMEMADIFAWDIDFNSDIRKGDQFSLVLEKKYREGKYIRNGRILGAKFVNRGNSYRAIYFEDDNGRGGYYTPDGGSLRRQFLKAPLRYSRISSGYTLKRLHPILKKFRPHQGVDYAAPKGTPVVAIGDGQILLAGRKGWNGIFVKLKHNGTYTSSYGHLLRLGKGIRRGVRVKQGQVIGYVGSTGMATGPHLDFRIRKNGKYVNPLKLDMPPARSVSRDKIEAFAAVRDRMLERLEGAGGIMSMSANREGGITN